MKILRSTAGGVVAILITALVITTFFLMHVLFSHPISGLAVELLAAAVAVVLVVASVGVTIYFQNKAETERQYRVCLFENKMQEYRKFLELTAKSDDDDRVEKAEIEEIRNQARVIAMLAQRQLLICLADFIDNLDRTQKLDRKDPVKGTFQQVVVAMRADLGVVDTTMEESKQAIHRITLKQ